jgi:hypothetical protein
MFQFCYQAKVLLSKILDWMATHFHTYQGEERVSKYYQRQAELKAYTTARADDVRNEFDAIQSAFELLAEPRKDGDIGFLTPFTIVDPVEPNHPATHAQVTAEHDKNNEQDARLDNTENLIAGMGPLDARFTTLRYVAEEGQTSMVLPGQFQSLAYVYKNGARLYQTVGFSYDVDTKTISFTEALTLNDEILIDVGVVPDAVLADLISIQNDIANRHADIELRNNDVISRQEDVATKHGDVVAKHSDVTDKHSDVTQITADFGDLATLMSDIQESELNTSSSASAAATSESNAANSASAASSSASAAAASESNAADSASAASSSAAEVVQYLAVATANNDFEVAAATINPVINITYGNHPVKVHVNGVLLADIDFTATDGETVQIHGEFSTHSIVNIAYGV